MHLVIQNLRIALGSRQIPMPQHLGDRFQRNAITQRNRRGESVPGDVKGEIFDNAPAICDFF